MKHMWTIVNSHPTPKKPVILESPQTNTVQDKVEQIYKLISKSSLESKENITNIKILKKKNTQFNKDKV